ncbi:1,2-phenylacetyl-CoA epoxidase subunit PaaC [Aneurinibacillus aneurinilyticus]|uniref:Phenylacetate-CoA oxygenase subunit PaaC n=1 Tax=Aneurinibacillus aneurinilyticus TaxID=1391 RepID=A0A848D2W5_ANEAE|nr:1,2-phenylacetyl-CoA epoxidase subunit PaaC [Aneurinibacillus aneurinilyticus]NMF01120.1 phenylacetate-CoA oxygenase subunit PaaC [Aneurinibacillus aneurinilyticus]
MVEGIRIATAEEAKENKQYLTSLQELLFQLADDDFILAYRGSEWLGLAPHIEEDVAFSSISQDTMGHSVMFYEMLEELEAGRADDLAHLRSPDAFRNAILVERVNGEGHYMEEPQYDWAYAIVRFYLYELFKLVRLESLHRSSYQPLAVIAQKMMTELRYHLYHWQVWMEHLVNGSEESCSKMKQALEKVWSDVSDLYTFGPKGEEMVRFGLIEGEALLAQRWMEKARQALESYGLTWPGKPEPAQLSGRAGQHTEEMVCAVATLSEVYRLNPAANW